MPFDRSSSLWSDATGPFFRDIELYPRMQDGPRCVSTSLSIMTGVEPEYFQEKINTQDPSSWSDSLIEWNMKLAYCPTDARKLKYYLDELIEVDDMFTLSFYLDFTEVDILAPPDKDGWVVGSHVVVLHRDKVLDPMYGDVQDARTHELNDWHTKRIFRVVPADYPRGV